MILIQERILQRKLCCSNFERGSGFKNRSPIVIFSVDNEVQEGQHHPLQLHLFGCLCQMYLRILIKSQRACDFMRDYMFLSHLLIFSY